MRIAIVNCFDTYEHRVDLLCEVFNGAGHVVSIMSSNFRHFEKTKRTKPKEGYVFFDAAPYKKNLSYKRMSSHYKLAKKIFGYLDNNEDAYDLIWVLVPPNSFVREAAMLKRSHSNLSLVFDLIDLWPETIPIGSIKNVFPFTVWKNLRDNYLRYADCIVTECELYQIQLHSILRGKKAETLYLARPIVPYIPQLRLSHDQLNICYLGSISNLIDIKAIGIILKRIKQKIAIELHIIGDGEHRQELITTAKKAGASVVFHGKIYDRVEKQKIFDNCDYGLNIMKRSVCVGLTMKSIDYFEFGLPIINNIKGDTWDVIEKYHCGVNTDIYDFNWEMVLVSEEEAKIMRKRSRGFFEDNLSTTVFNKKALSVITGTVRTSE